MTISGMTGFARTEGAFAGMRWIWELKSVNGRGLDVKLRLPSGYDALEQPVRAAAAQRFKRGSLQCSLLLARDDIAEAAAARVDLALAEKLIAAGEPFVAAGRVGKASWDGILALRGVVVSEDVAQMGEDERAALEGALLSAFQTGLDAPVEARNAEGRMLAATLLDLAERLDGLITQARVSAAAAPSAALERIRQRLETLAPEFRIDPARLAQEAAIAATRADVQEELERLAAHAVELRTLLAKPEPAGRRLDFLGQELTRESNTLCSKSADLELTRIGLDMKTVVDQIKEQAANVE